MPLLFGLVNAGFGRMNYALATMLIGFGGLALAVAWNAGPHKALDSRRFAKLTARAPAHVAERWLAVEFDPADVGTAATWYAAARASPCVVVQYTTEWSAIARRAFCGRRLPLADSLSPHRVTELTPGVPFSWQRDERGFIVPELRMSAAAKQWLSAHKPSSSSAAVAGDPHALDELSALRLSMEQPVEGAIAGWGTEEGDFVLALDPSQPGQAWPAGFVVDEARRRPQWPMAAIGALIGLLFWFNGMQIFTAGAPRSRAWFVTIVPLLALPWWGDGFGRALRPLNASFAPVIGGMMATVGELERLVASAPDEAALVDGERLSWRVDGGAYADTFKAFTFRLPQPRPADPNAALLAFNDAIATQMRAFEAKTQARVFDRLAQDKRDGQSRAGFAFLRAAQQALVDPSRPPAVQDAARGFLKSCVTQPVDDPFPGEIAFESRLALLRELATIPPPNDIAAPAGWIVSRAEERRDAPPLRPGGD
ncbi:MAG: hypothetical protein ABI682_04355 [Acidobacteriota bacterium]